MAMYNIFLNQEIGDKILRLESDKINKVVYQKSKDMIKIWNELSYLLKLNVFQKMFSFAIS